MDDDPASASPPSEPAAHPLYRGTRADLKPDEKFYHGTRVNLHLGDLLGPGYASNYGQRRQANHIYFSATLEATIWGAELAQGAGPGRIYVVEPSGPFVDDPNLTDKKFPGNPTKSYRSRDPLRVTGEVKDWPAHSAEQLKKMKDFLEQLKQQGVGHVDD